MTDWRQYLLRRKTNGVTEFLLCWMEYDKRVRVGSIISLKGESKRWEVTKIYVTVIEHKALQTVWGLKLPKSQRTER